VSTHSVSLPRRAYLGEAEEEQLVLGVIDEARKRQLIRTAGFVLLIRSVSLSDPSVVRDVLTLSVDAVHLQREERVSLYTHSRGLSVLKVSRAGCWPILSYPLDMDQSVLFYRVNIQSLVQCEKHDYSDSPVLLLSIRFANFDDLQTSCTYCSMQPYNVRLLV
jgi:hypothetical protein